MEDGQVPSPYMVEELQKLRVTSHPTRWSHPSFLPVCFASLGREEALMCAWDSVLRFAQRAWRRPIDTESRLELESFLVSESRGGFDRGSHWFDPGRYPPVARFSLPFGGWGSVLGRGRASSYCF